MARRAAEADEAREPRPRRARRRDGPDDYRWSETEVILTRAELAQAAGHHRRRARASSRSTGSSRPSHTSRDRVLFDEDALAIARVASSFMRHGIEARHLRMYRAFAEREAGLFEQVLLPYRRQRNPEAQARTAGDARRALRASAASCAPRCCAKPFAVRSWADVPATVLLDADAVAAHVRAARRRDRTGPSRRRRARRRAEGRAALRRRPRPGDHRRTGRGRLHVDLAVRPRLRPGKDPARPRLRHRRPRRRDRRGHGRHRPHARVPDRPARGPRRRGALSACTLLDRPIAADRARTSCATAASCSTTSSCSATACTPAICTATCPSSRPATASVVAATPDAYVDELYGRGRPSGRKAGMRPVVA